MDVCHPPHCRAQEGWPGAHAGPQHIQQVPDVALIKLQGEAMSANASTRGHECESPTDVRSKRTRVLASAPTTRVMGLMPSVLGMKRRRDMTVDLGRAATSSGVNSII